MNITGNSSTPNNTILLLFYSNENINLVMQYNLTRIIALYSLVNSKKGPPVNKQTALLLLLTGIFTLRFP